MIKVFTTEVVHAHLLFPTGKYLPSPGSNHLPLDFLLTRGERRSVALPLLFQGGHGRMRTRGVEEDWNAACAYFCVVRASSAP